MKCLDIPVDHRLRNIIRRQKVSNLGNQCGNHVQLLRDFGEALRDENESLSSTLALNFACSLAEPATTGGIVIALDQPSKSQTFDGSQAAIIEICNTLKAIRDLVMITSNHHFTIDDVSVFDALPILTQKYDETNEAFKNADNTFLNMVAAKMPRVVLCCFKAQSKDVRVKNFQSSGVGQSKLQSTFIFQGIRIEKVNAFHPSYMINYQPEYSCFRRLLTLDFAQAFGVLRDDWREFDWMQELRNEATSYLMNKD
ncbi:hypothetical protein LTR66_015354 [Elasticomyces elasticus]|nr:hypothetical protein LTR66_015354 [Elasticomyces elasticus]